MLDKNFLTPMTLREIHARGDFLTHEKLWIAFHNSRNVDYRHTDYLFSSGRWRGYEWRDVRETPSLASTLVLGHSDKEVTLPMVEDVLSHTQYRFIYASNVSSEAAKLVTVHDLPVGIPNRERQSKTHIIQGDQTLVTRAWKKAQRRALVTKPTIYANFSSRTNPSVRNKVLDIVAPLSHVKKGSFQLSKKGRALDLETMAQSGIVLCPRGNGMDTHRVWEALLVGAVPALLATDHSARLLRELALPHISLTSWEEVRDYPNITARYLDCIKESWDFSGLSASWWISRIEAHIS